MNGIVVRCVTRGADVGAINTITSIDNQVYRALPISVSLEMKMTFAGVALNAIDSL